MRAPMIVKGQIAADRAARLADAIVGFQVDLLVFDASPQALDEHVVSPGASAVPATRERRASGSASEPSYSPNHCMSLDGAKTAIVGITTALPLDRTRARNVHLSGRGDMLSMATCLTLHLARI